MKKKHRAARTRRRTPAYQLPLYSIRSAELPFPKSAFPENMLARPDFGDAVVGKMAHGDTLAAIQKPIIVEAEVEGVLLTRSGQVGVVDRGRVQEEQGGGVVVSTLVSYVNQPVRVLVQVHTEDGADDGPGILQNAL